MQEKMKDKYKGSNFRKQAKISQSKGVHSMFSKGIISEEECHFCHWCQRGRVTVKPCGFNSTVTKEATR
jgi:molybdenum cofactor biosynthesis enzyme MoaA